MRFQTTLLQTGPTATGMEVPDEVVEALRAGKRPPVLVTINGYTYRNTIAVMGGVYMVGVSAEHRAGAESPAATRSRSTSSSIASPGSSRSRPTSPRRSTGIPRPADSSTACPTPPGSGTCCRSRGRRRWNAPAPDREVGRDAPRGPGSLSRGPSRGCPRNGSEAPSARVGPSASLDAFMIQHSVDGGRPGRRP